MTLFSRVAGLTLAAAALLAACSAPGLPKATPPPPPPVAHPGARLVTVSDANAGASVTLDAAQELVVSLPIGVAAGLEWSLVDLKPDVLTLSSSKFERGRSDMSDQEGDGAIVWHFKPKTAGTVTLTFDLRRPRSVLPAVRTVIYNVTVQ